MNTDNYVLIRAALLFAQTLIVNDMNKGDSLGIFKDKLKENKKALELLKQEV